MLFFKTRSKSVFYTSKIIYKHDTLVEILSSPNPPSRQAMQARAVCLLALSITSTIDEASCFTTIAAC